MKRTVISVFAVLALTTSAYAQDDFGDGMDDTSSDSSSDMGDTSASEPADSAVDAETTMKLGVGVATTLGGNAGAEVEYFLGDQLMITGMFGFTQISPKGEGAESATNIFLAAGGFYRLAGTGRSALMVGGRLVIGNASATAVGSEEDGSTQFNLEVPARVEVWLSKILSVHFETGLLLAFVPENGAALAPGGPADGSVVRLGSNLFGSGGITVYLP